ncbi:hypothetical protein KY284_013096 [Solanum tuberosum]|nr:hypothetical protein KY284_013096 [Solanum tuberosum]
MTQVISFTDLNILPTYYAIESTSKVGNSNAEQVFDEMPLAKDSPFSSANGDVMSMEGYAVTTEAHSLDVCSQQTNHEVFVDEQSNATTFSSEGHSDLEDEILEQVCDVQAKFEGSMGDYLNMHPILLTIAHAYSPISTIFLCPMSPDNATNLNLQVELDRNFSMNVSHKTPEEELKFPNHLIVQLIGSHLARVESAKRISKYDTIMKLAAVFEELLAYMSYLAGRTTTEALDLAWHSLEFGTRFNEESSTIMPPVGNNKSSLFPSDEFQSTYPDAQVEYEFWANSDVECCSKCENQWAFFTHFKGAAQAIEQNHLPPYSIIWYFPKYASVFACQDTFWCSMREFPILLELIFVGDGYTQYCGTSGALCCTLNLRVYWEGPKDDMIYSTCIGDNKKGCDCNSLEMGNACLVIQDVNVVILHNLAALDAN